MSIAKPRGVDCHAHVFSAGAAPVAGARYRPSYAATVEAWRAHREPAGITHGVLVQPSFFGTDNAEMLATLACDAARLRGVAVLDPRLDVARLRSLDAKGVRAVRLNLQSVADYGAYAREPWTTHWSRIAALGWHVEAFVEAGRAPELAHALREAPLDVVFDHFANPGTDAAATFAALRELAAGRAVWVKLSGPYRLLHADARPLARALRDALGPDRLVWGSDWPWTRHEAGRDYARSRAELDAWMGSEGAPAVLWDNAARLYRFD